MEPKKRTCGASEVHQRLLNTIPAYADNRRAIERHTMAWGLMRRSMPAPIKIITIPVVVHVVYSTPEQNISDAQIHSQLVVLNDDYRKRNADIGLVPAPFQPLAADLHIEFKLACRDPKGDKTDGITRTKTNVTEFTDDDRVKSNATGGIDAWPTDKYLNLWVCQLDGLGLLGYAQFPGGPPTTDGVVITHTGFGTLGTATAPFNKGRTGTHEIGHWLDLYHIWGDDQNKPDPCSGSDNVADTPNQAIMNYACPTFPHISCNNGPNGDMFMNYMDYTDDACMYMFTKGQGVRTEAALNGPRIAIVTSDALNCPIEELKVPLEKDKLLFDGANKYVSEL
jgi:Pregnancy-associated plasma protein-A